MDLSELAVSPTLLHLVPLLPEPPARILEAGCGAGALAAALVALGYEVTGVDRNAEMVVVARRRGLSVIHADLNDLAGEFDVVLFTRSLHHAEDLDRTLAHAAALLAPGGRIILEEFAWERVDRSAAEFHYDSRALLAATDVLRTEAPVGDLLEAWIGGHRALHTGDEMLAALTNLGGDLEVVPTSMLWRLVDGKGGEWAEPTTRVGEVLGALRSSEERRIAAETLPAVGLLAALS